MKKILNILARYVFALVMLCSADASYADEILRVDVHGDIHTFTFEDLAAMPQSTVVTKNDFVDAASTFTGPSLRYICDLLEIGPDSILQMYALNDFSVVISASDGYEFNVILALEMNGERMSIRDRGPIWVIYPMDDIDPLLRNRYNARLIWQLQSITVE